MAPTEAEKAALALAFAPASPRTQAEAGGPLSHDKAPGGGGVAAAVDPLAEWRVPLNAVQLERCLAQGATGEVWRANLNGAPVALKRLLRSVMTDADVVAKFRREILLLSILSHPFITQFQVSAQGAREGGSRQAIDGPGATAADALTTPALLSMPALHSSSPHRAA